MANKTRPKSVIMRLTEGELTTVTKKMEQAGIKNREAYLRKMALHGYIVRFDTTEAQELLRLISNATGNINQIARRCNESRSVYESDARQLAEEVAQLKEHARKAVNIYKKARMFLDA